MNEKARRILEEAGAARDPAARTVGEIADAEALASESYVQGITPFRLWLGEPPDIGGKMPGRGFYETFLGHGRAGAVALLEGFERETPDTPDARERLPVWKACALAARVARNRGHFGGAGWSLDGWRPAALDAGKAKVAAYVSDAVSEKIRVIAFERRASLSALVEESLAATVAQEEARRGSEIPVRHAEVTP